MRLRQRRGASRFRRTARLRFTVLSGVLFMVSGLALLAFTYLLFDNSSHGSAAGAGSGPSGTLPGLGAGQASSGGHHIIHVGNASTARQIAAAAQSAADKHDLLIDSGLALLVVAALAVLLGWFFAGRMLAPVTTITQTARRISASNLDQRLALHDADDEFRELGDTLDDLLARLKASFDTQQHFVANASHELRTPLTAQRALLQVALDDPNTTSQEWRATARELIAVSDEQEQLIEALLALASSEAGFDNPEPIDLTALTHTILLDRRPDADDHRIEITTATAPATATGSPALIERLIANLIDNAIRHNTPGGHVHIQTTTTTDEQVRLIVSNTGPDIPASEIARLFQPFQRLKTTRTNNQTGHGLGLSIVHAIATAHHAQINARPQPDGGLWIEISFPQSRESPEAANARGPHVQQQDYPGTAPDAFRETNARP